MVSNLHGCTCTYVEAKAVVSNLHLRRSRMKVSVAARDLAKDGIFFILLGTGLLILCVVLLLPPLIQRLAGAAALSCALGAVLVLRDVSVRGLVRFMSPHMRELLTEGCVLCCGTLCPRTAPLPLPPPFTGRFCNFCETTVSQRASGRSYRSSSVSPTMRSAEVCCCEAAHCRNVPFPD